MKENNLKIICWTLFGSICVVAYFGIFWTISLSNAEFTIKFDIDEETERILLENDYCLATTENYTFIGECSYLNNNRFFEVVS